MEDLLSIMLNVGLDFMALPGKLYRQWRVLWQMNLKMF
jgi:hypothetical protein